jgi:hypothetical protein
MEGERKKSGGCSAIVFAVIMLLPLVAYVSGCFLASQKYTAPDLQTRCYRYRWQSAIFSPAAKAESVFTGNKVVVTSAEEVVEELRPFLPPKP